MGLPGGAAQPPPGAAPSLCAQAPISPGTSNYLPEPDAAFPSGRGIRTTARSNADTRRGRPLGEWRSSPRLLLSARPLISERNDRWTPPISSTPATCSTDPIGGPIPWPTGFDNPARLCQVTAMLAVRALCVAAARRGSFDAALRSGQAGGPQRPPLGRCGRLPSRHRTASTSVYRTC